MAEKSPEKLSSDWVRCQSKSRAGRFYLFNKKTGETNWCSDAESNNHLTTVLAKNVLKTPAQDRLKRLQNQIEKKRTKEAETGRRTKKEESKSQKTNSKSVKTASPIRSDKDEARKSPLPSKKRTNVSSKTPENLPSTSKSSSVQHRLIVVSKKTPDPSVSENRKQAASIQSSVPHNRKLNSSLAIDKEPTNSKSDMSIRESNINLPGVRPQTPRNSVKQPMTTCASLQDKDTAVMYDENKNQQKSEGKMSFLSKIKGLCTSLLKGSKESNKRKQDDKKDEVRLSATSKPSFKHKKQNNKSLLRGISCDIESETIHNSDLIIAKSPKALPSPTVIKESANSRLDRLRKSLQQSLPSHPIPCALSEESLSTSIEPDCEPMDWQPIAEETTTSAPSTSSGISADLSILSDTADTVNENIMRLAAAKKQTKDWKKDHFYFVVDTNVFIQNPTFVEDLTTMKLCDTMGTVIYIPYTVLQELDKLKIRSPSESVKLRTTRAIKLLNKAFEERHPQFQAQSAADEGVHLIKVTSPDDSILNCCLQVKHHVDNLLLLTEDVNLQSKAICNDILVSTKSDLISLH